MSTKYNQLYNNPALTRAFSNIANTLVGSASDDAATARANYLRSQTEGQGGGRAAQGGARAGGEARGVFTVTGHGRGPGGDGG